MARSNRHFADRFQHKIPGFSTEILPDIYLCNPGANDALLYDHDELNGKAPAKALSTLVTRNYDLALGTRKPALPTMGFRKVPACPAGGRHSVL